MTESPPPDAAIDAPEQRNEIDPLSLVSIAIYPHSDVSVLATATGFVMRWHKQSYLVTNQHVVSGKNPETGALLSTKTGEVPTGLMVDCHSSEKLGMWRRHFVKLFDSEGGRLWGVHPKHPDFDVAALALVFDPSVRLYPVPHDLVAADVMLRPAMSVSIIGFPFGDHGVFKFPLWKTGHIASDPNFDVALAPYIHIDATTRQGMSGSPVFRRAYDGYQTRNGNLHIGGHATRFVGIYSGRTRGMAPDGSSEGSEIGRVWRPEIIEEVLKATPIPRSRSQAFFLPYVPYAQEWPKE